MNKKFTLEIRADDVMHMLNRATSYLHRRRTRILRLTATTTVHAQTAGILYVVIECLPQDVTLIACRLENIIEVECITVLAANAIPMVKV